MKPTLFLLGLLLSTLTVLSAQSPVFTPVVNKTAVTPAATPFTAAHYVVDAKALEGHLAKAPHQTDLKSEAPFFVTLPGPEGESFEFQIVAYDQLEPELAAKFPGIRNYLGVDRNNPLRRVRLDWTPRGMHASVVGGSEGRWYAQPDEDGAGTQYHMYYTSDYPLENPEALACSVEEEAGAAPGGVGEEKILSNCELRSYRLALACSGEYYQFHGGSDALVLAEMNTAIARVNQVMELDFGTRLIIIGNNDQLLFDDPNTDPYTNEANGAQLSVNQTTVDNIIGSGNYDVGHLFTTSSGGIAALGSVCNNSQKAAGVTGLPSPVGDPFYIDFVAHELGHQFGGNHTFNGTTGNCSQRNASTAYEPGGGTTVQGYAGICSALDNIQQNSDPYYHIASLIEYDEEQTSSNGGIFENCQTVVADVSNNAPVVDAGPDFMAPPGAGLIFDVASSSDADGDALTYCWEQYDLGAAHDGPATGNETTGPLFRSKPPTADSRRLIDGSDEFETLSNVARDISMRVTVRDVNMTFGCPVWDEKIVTIVGTVPFAVVSPNGGETIAGGSTTTVTWAVAGSDAYCSEVDIEFSTDGGVTYTVLAANQTNSGSASVSFPDFNEDEARVRVVCSAQTFFDASDANFTVTSDCIAPNTTISSTGATDFGDGVAADLTLENFIPGTVIPSFSASNFNNAGIGINGMNGGCENSFLGIETFTFTVDATGTYSFNFSDNFVGYSIYSGVLDSGNPCTGFLGSNMTSTGGGAFNANGAAVSVVLTQGETYSVAITNAFGGAGTNSVAASGPGNTTAPGMLPADFAYTYVAVDASGNIVAVSTDANFGVLPTGSYEAYGVAYLTTGTGSVDPSTLVNTAFADLSTVGCLRASDNSIPFTSTQNVVDGDDDEDGTLNSAEAAGEENNPCAPDDATLAVTAQTAPDAGMSNGSVTLTASGGADAGAGNYVFELAGQANMTVAATGDGNTVSATFISLAAGTYAATVTDPSGQCTAMTTVTLTGQCPTTTAPAVTTTSNSSFGTNDGTATVDFSASGGSPEYTFDLEYEGGPPINNGNTTSSGIFMFTDLPPDSYITVNAVDANGCPVPDATFMVIDLCDIDPEGDTCPGGDDDRDGAINAEELLGEANNPCAPDDVTLVIDGQTDFVFPTGGSVTLTAGGGADAATGDYSFSLTGQAGMTAPAAGDGNTVSVTFSGLAPGAYTATVLDPSESCEATIPVTIVEIGLFFVTCAENRDTVFVDENCAATLPDYAATATASGPGAAITQDSMAGSLLTTDENGTVEFTVTVTASDDQGQTATCTTVVTVRDTIAPVATCATGTFETMPGQVNEPSDNAGGCALDNSIFFQAQSFTADEDADLVGIRVNRALFNNDPTVEFWVTIIAGGTPNGPQTVLGQSQPAPIGSGDVIDAILDTPVPLVNGQEYTVIFNVNTNGSFFTIVCQSEAIPGGTGWTGVSPTTWFALGNHFPMTTLVGSATAPMVELQPGGTATLTSADLDGGSTDNCGIASITIDPTDVTCADSPVMVTQTVTDFSGNTATCTVEIELQDVTPPTVDCPEFTATLAGCPTGLGPNTPTGDWQPVPASGMIQSFVGGSFSTTIDVSTCVTDDCSDLGELEFTLGAAFEENRTDGSVTLVNVLIFRDAAENEAADSVFVRITIEDSIDPEVECESSAVVYLDDAGFASIDSTFVVDSVLLAYEDDCSTEPTTVTLSETEFGCAHTPEANTTILIVTAEFADAAGNPGTCEFALSVLDTISPVVLCRDTIIALDSMGMADLTNLDALISETDNCGLLLNSPATLEPVDCMDADSVFTFNFSAVDAAGNTGNCTGTITVVDTIAPVISCVSDTIYLDADGLVSDAPGENVTVELEACPPTMTVGSPLAIFTCDAVGVLEFTETRTDASGNVSEPCTFTVTVLDTIAPSLVCVADTTVLIGEDGTVALDLMGLVVSAEDNCAPLTTIDNFSGLTFNCADVGDSTLVNAITLVDDSGNTTSCTITVTVQDAVGPVGMSPDTVLYLDENGLAQLTIADFEDNYTDNCDAVTVTDIFRIDDNTAAAAGAGEGSEAKSVDQVLFFDCDDVGNLNLMVEIVVEDGNGNPLLDTIDVTVLDTIAPVLTCSDTTIVLGMDGTISYSADVNVLNVVEACPPNMMVGDPLQVFTCDDLGETVVTATRTDASGNTGSCDITVTITDDNMVCNMPPEAVCQDLILQVDADGNVAFDPADLDGGSTDDNTAAEDLVFTSDFSAADFGCDNVGQGAITVSLIVTDDAGLADTCTAQVTVEDNIAPVVTVTVDPLMINLTDAEPEMTVDFPAFVTATDNCDDELDFEADRDLTFTGTDIGSGSFTVTVTDDSGNPTTVTINFVVTFDQPNLACIGDINLTLNDECQGLLIPSMVLTGNTALNEFFDFDIVVQDSDPSNGPIIDGCGEFVYMISQRSDVAGPATLGFTGAYAPDQWFSAPFGAGDLFNNNTDEQIVTIDHTATTLEMTTFATVFSTGSQFGAQSSIQFGEMATVSFDYDFNGVDAFFDQAFSLTTFEGEVVDIGFNTITEEGGNVSFDVQPGYALIIQLRDDGFQPFAGPAPSVLTITGFEVAPMAADNPLDLDFESCWGIVRAEDKTPPAVVNQIAPIDLLCVDLDDNQVNTLPNNVDRCYEVFSATGATVPGTMATALRNALSAEVGNSAAIVPTFTDGCTERLEVCVTESIAFDDEDPQCNDVVLTRTFTATEIAVCPSASGESNGSTVSSYVITFSRPSLDDLDADNIEEVANYDECGVTTGTIAEIMASYPAPRAEDFPFLVVGDRSFPLMDGEAVCNIGVTFADGQPIITCPNTYKFVRTYTVIDWCDPSDVRTFTQVVKVGDTEAPTFSGPTQDRDFDGVIDDDLIFSTNAGNQCAAYIVLDGPGVSATDNCEGAITITAQIYPGGDLTASPIGPFVVDLTDGNAEVTSPIPVGTHLLRYTYEDVCGNADFSDFEFTVEDGTAPVAICEDGLNISITSGQTQGGGASTGIAILTPEMIDAGSYDDCSGITLEIARVNGNNVATEAYDQELILSCADLGIVRVGLKVTDAEGNMNFCWLDVLVEDKNAPTCLPPGPVALTCVEYLAAGLPADINEASEDELNALFGSAVGIDNCEVTITSTVSGGVNSCGVGSLMRSFVATDGEGFVDDDNCEQFIEIRGVFDYRITFPTDEVFDECVDPDFNQLGAEEFACDLITTNVTMDTIAAVNAPDACYTLRVNYDVINFCEYNQLGECYRIPRDGDGIRNPDTQLLYLNVIPNNTANTGDDIAFLSRFTDRNYNPGAPQRDQLVDDGDDNDGSDDDNSNDSEEQQAANGVGFAYAQDNSRGYFCYVQFVDVYDEVAPTIEGDEPEECFAGTSADCTAEVELTFTADDNCTTPVVTVELDADYNVNAGFIPVNPASAGVSVSVSNDGINYTVNASNVPVGNHAIRIRANDGCGNFDSEIIEFCVEGDKAPTPICIQQLTVTLMPDGNGGGMAEIWASDFIASDVEDCFGNVIDQYSIYTEEEAGAAGFEPQVGDLGLTLTCDSDQTTPVRVYAIADNGSADYCSVFVLTQLFQPGLCTGNDGTVNGLIATQRTEPIAGVEVTLTGAEDMDMTAMTAANGAYSFTGLPVNEDYTVQPTYNVGVNLSNVTVADVNLMGNVILGIDQFATPYDYLAADTDRDQQLTVGDMVTTQRIILGLEDNFAISNWGFVPADVDVSDPYSEAFPEVFNANDLVGNVVADFVGYELGNVNAANRSSASIEVEDAQLEAGQTHTLTIAAGDLLGFQGTLELAAGLEVMDVRYDGVGGVNLREVASGAIPMMFLADGVVEVDVHATAAGRLSELVTMTSGVTIAEGVNANGTAGPLSLAFVPSSAPATAPELFQNTPNPVVDMTTIRFRLTETGPAVLTLRDAAGRLLREQKINGIAGMNRVELTDLNASGVITYTLTAGDFSATRKMVVVR